MKMLKSKKFYLTYLITCMVSKQAMKVSEGRRVYLAYLVVYTTKLYYKILENRRVCLIYLMFYITNSQNRKNT